MSNTGIFAFWANVLAIFPKKKRVTPTRARSDMATRLILLFVITRKISPTGSLPKPTTIETLITRFLETVSYWHQFGLDVGFYAILLLGSINGVECWPYRFITRHRRITSS